MAVSESGSSGGRGTALESPHNLPTPPTPLVGRAQEVAAATHRLQRDDVRLLTLTGPPGIGKTRLAIEIASALLAEFPHGVSFIDLAPVTEARLVLPAVAYALGIRQGASKPYIRELSEHLASKRVLLVLDNVEQVVAAAPALIELLQGTLHVKMLVTSRELLRISGEQHLPVPPLPLPPVLVDQGAPRALAALTPERLGEYDAVRLFVQRASALQPDFALTAENALTLAGICCRLDGLPLAIELAAARVRHIPLPEIYDRLERRLQVLTSGPRDLPPRQRTLRSAIAWSYNLLDAGERLLLARLAVFRGGCSLQAVEAVCGEGLSIAVFDGLASLVDKSLIQQIETSAGAARFVLLEMIREFARERLEEDTEFEALRRRHARHVAGLAERAEPELRLAQQKHWFHLLELEIDNLRAALEWSLGGGDLTIGIQIMSSTFLYWYSYGRQDEGMRWTQQLLARIDQVEPEHQVRLLRSAAMLISYWDEAAALALSTRALAIARDLGDKRQLGWVLWMLGATSIGNTMTEAFVEAQALFTEIGDRQGLAFVLNALGEQARHKGDNQAARSAYAEALAIAEELGDIRLQYVVLFNSSFIAQHVGDHREALRLLHRSVALAAGVPTDVARGLLAIAGSLGAMGEAVRAARLFGAAQAFLLRSGAIVHPDDQPEHDRNFARVRHELGEAAFAEACAEGQHMTLEQAIAYSRESTDPDAPPLPQPARAEQQLGDLTRRERQVALLIAEGRSNRAIAESLVITERTVEGHVSNILSKLGFQSRTQISVWVAAHVGSDR